MLLFLETWRAERAKHQVSQSQRTSISVQIDPFPNLEPSSSNQGFGDREKVLPIYGSLVVATIPGLTTWTSCTGHLAGEFPYPR